jgi:hypothetical protein
VSLTPPKRWRAIALALVIFVSGAVAGAAVTLTTLRHTAQTSFRQPKLVPARLAARIRSRLRLDAGQEAAVARIFAEHQAAWSGIRRSVRPQVEAELEGLRHDVTDVLTPRQAALWNRWFKRGRERWLPAPDDRPRS